MGAAEKERLFAKLASQPPTVALASPPPPADAPPAPPRTLQTSAEVKPSWKKGSTPSTSVDEPTRNLSRTRKEATETESEKREVASTSEVPEPQLLETHDNTSERENVETASAKVPEERKEDIGPQKEEIREALHSFLDEVFTVRFYFPIFLLPSS